MSVASDTKLALHSLSQWLAKTPWRVRSEEVDKWIETLESPCAIAVSGKVKSGKSSFINALLRDDLAVVGELETTATINLFRHSSEPRGMDEEVKCVWSDGREEWKGRAFLNALQGHDEVTLRAAEGIDHLEFFIDRPTLSHVTLIDTPGYGAYVGNDGDEHERRLREWHSAQTQRRTSAADAVIFLVDAAIANLGEEDISFIKSAKGGAPLLAADRSLVILSRADMLSDDDRAEKVASLQNELGRIAVELANVPVLAVSAGVQRVLNRFDEGKLQTIFDDCHAAFSGPNDIKLKSERLFPHNVAALHDFKLSFDWAAVRCILGTFLQHDDFANAFRALQDVAGFNVLQEALERIFFERTYVLRCESAIEAAQHLINRIQDVDFDASEQERRELLALREFVTRGAATPVFQSEPSIQKSLMRLIDAKTSAYTNSVAEMKRTLIDVERRVSAVVAEGGPLQTLNVIYRIRTLLARQKEHILKVADRGEGWFSCEDVKLLEEHCAGYLNLINDRSFDMEQYLRVWEGVESMYRGDVKCLATFAVEFYHAFVRM